MQITNNVNDYSAPWIFVRDNIKGKILEIGPLFNAFKINNESSVEYADFKSRDQLVLDHSHRDDYDVKLCPEIKYVTTAQDLSIIPDKTFNAVISSHVFEHIANPIEAIKEWVRVLQNNGYIYFIVPDKNYHKSFDKPRPLTTLAHIGTDYEQHVTKIELSAYQEMYDFGDEWSRKVHQMDKPNWVMDSFDRQDSIHAHTFTPESLKTILLNYEKELGYKLLDLQLLGEMHICCLLQKENI